MSLGGGSDRSSSFGYSQSDSRSSSSSTQRIAFQDIFRNLFSGGSIAARDAVAGAEELGTVARDLFTGGSRFLEDLGGDAGTEYLNSRLSGESGLVDEQIDLLQEDVSRLFTEELQPAITSTAVAGGTLGGGRQGVAEGLATEAATREFARGAATIRANDIASRDAAAATVAQNSLQAANTGLGSLPMLLDLAKSGNNAEIDIFSQLSTLLGSPTVLTDSVAESFARSFGQQSSDSSSFDLSFGF